MEFRREWAGRGAAIGAQMFAEAIQAALSKTDDPVGKRMLSIGASSASKEACLAKHGVWVTASDIDERKMREVANNPENKKLKQLLFVVASADALPFADKSFDYTFSCSVLQYVDHVPVISECARVLKDSGCSLFIENMALNPFVLPYRLLRILFEGSPRKFWEIKEHLRFAHLSEFQQYYGSVLHEEQFLFSSLALAGEVMFRRRWQKFKRWQKVFQLLEVIDRHVLKVFPFLKRFCWLIALTCWKNGGYEPVGYSL